jgi:hypothetical protein
MVALEVAGRAPARATPGPPAWIRRSTPCRAAARRDLRVHGGRGGGRLAGRGLARGASPGHAPGCGCGQRVPGASRWTWAAGASTRSRSPRRGSRSIGSRRRHLGSRVDAPRRQRRGPRGRGREPPRATGRTQAHGDHGDGSSPTSRSLTPEQRGSSRPSAGTTRGAARRPSVRSATRRTARVMRALLRDTISPDVIHAGVKYNVIPGTATIEIDCRTLPGTTEADVREEVLARLGDLGPSVRPSSASSARCPVEAPVEGDLFALLADCDPGPRPGRHPRPGDGPVRDRRKAHGEARRADVRLLPAPPGTRRAIPGQVPRRGRARRASRRCAGVFRFSTT